MSDLDTTSIPCVLVKRAFSCDGLGYWRDGSPCLWCGISTGKRRRVSVWHWLYGLVWICLKREWRWALYKGVKNE